MAIAPWRLSLQPASYNGVQFHVGTGSRMSGRRNAGHEFPKRELPYTEDMGRRARKFTVVGYVIGPNFENQRDLLIEQLEKEGNGNLVLPTSSDTKTVVTDTYIVVERREQGGYAEIEMVFLEAGQDPSIQVTNDTSAAVKSAADSASGRAGNTSTSFLNSGDITRILQ